MHGPSPDRLLADLSRPSAYPWAPHGVELIETHISWVFLAGNRVLKVKRPVRYPFVDHSTVERRRRSCEAEVTLNRRLTEGVYLGVLPIAAGGDGLVVGGPGPPVEWATLMRRLPGDRMLDRLLRDRARPDDLVDRLAERLIPFHRSAAPCPADVSAYDPSPVLIANLDEVRGFAGRPIGNHQFAVVDRAVRAMVETDADLFRRRAAEGWVRDGHGDLRPEHVCLEDGRTQVFDCVEFSASLRCADVASDVAFLLMELDCAGAGGIAAGLVDRYRSAGIPLPPALLRVYRTHRALVRVKTGCLTWQTSGSLDPDLPRFIQRYLNAAARDAVRIRPFLAMMSGLSGTGKSTLGRALADAAASELVASDAVRKELAGAAGRATAPWGAGIYAPAWTDRTYARLRELASAALSAGRPAILDATFLDTAEREATAEIGKNAGVPVLLIETTCDDRTAAARLAARSLESDSLSDATESIYRQQRSLVERDRPRVPPGVAHLVVDTTTGELAALDLVFGALVERGIAEPRAV